MAEMATEAFCCLSMPLCCTVNAVLLYMPAVLLYNAYLHMERTRQHSYGA